MPGRTLSTPTLLTPVLWILLAACGDSDRSAADTVFRPQTSSSKQRDSSSEERETAKDRSPPRVQARLPPNIELPSSDKPEPEPRDRGVVTRGRAKVTFSAPREHFTQIDLDGKILDLEPRETVDLDPGIYWPSIRTRTDDPWQQANELIIEAGGPYKVALRNRREWHIELLERPDDTATEPSPAATAENPAPLPTAPSSDNPIDSPIVGYWREVARLPCGKGRPYEPARPIEELVVWAAGSFRLARVAFETRFDYNGEYRVDLDRKQVELHSFGGSSIPDDIDPRGRYKRKGSKLILEDMWLGSARDSLGGRACGHVFEPFH